MLQGKKGDQNDVCLECGRAHSEVGDRMSGSGERMTKANCNQYWCLACRVRSKVQREVYKADRGHTSERAIEAERKFE